MGNIAEELCAHYQLLGSWSRGQPKAQVLVMYGTDGCHSDQSSITTAAGV